MSWSCDQSEFWMRPVAFPALLRILHTLGQYTDGLRPSQLNDVIIHRKLVLTQQGRSPSKTTLYHYRNTLLRLGILERIEKRLVVNSWNPEAKILLEESSESIDTLTPRALDAFVTLVLQNPDCRMGFFNLFMDPNGDYTRADFRNHGVSVCWRTHPKNGFREVQLVSEKGRTKEIRLRSPSEIKSILYGVRYWARNELSMIDEFFREDRGAVMYPIVYSDDLHESSLPTIIQTILSSVKKDSEWSTISLRDMAVRCCEDRHLPLKLLFRALQRLMNAHSDSIVLIPTSRSFAAVTAVSHQRENMELRGYFRDKQGRYISHIRIHHNMKEVLE